MLLRRSLFFCSSAALAAGACHAEKIEDAPPYDPHTAASECAGCHPDHAREWRMSPHAYAMIDPVFHAMVRLGQAETQGKLDQFCTRCHAPIGVETGQTEVAWDGSAGEYRQKTQGRGAGAMMGVSCEVCHSMTTVKVRANAQFEMRHDNVRRATIDNPIPTTAHGTEFSLLHGKSEMCGACHTVVNELFTPVALEETFIEWMQSTFPGQKECQDCHMPEYQGRAAVNGPERRIHRHLFVGVDVPLVAAGAFPGYDEMRVLTRSLLEESAMLTVVPVPAERRIQIRIENLAGHALPSGATADREMWLEIRITDANGDVVFESGTLDDNDDLRVDDPHRTTQPGTDPQLILYTQNMYFDPNLEGLGGSRRQVDFLWQANQAENHLIRAGATDERSYDLSTLKPGMYTAHVRLLFRSFPPHLLRRLVHEAGLDPEVPGRVPTVEMESATIALMLR